MLNIEFGFDAKWVDFGVFFEIEINYPAWVTRHTQEIMSTQI